MKKKTKIAFSATAGVMAVGIGIAGVWLYQPKAPGMTDLVASENETASSGVIVNINSEIQELLEYKEITDEETGETVIAEVQVNEPIGQKSTTPPQKPKANGNYTNPEQPPAYTKEQTVIEEKPQAAKKTNQSVKSGQVYIDGFGYVDKAGQTKTQTGVSDGDINKMVGSMD